MDSVKELVDSNMALSAIMAVAIISALFYYLLPIQQCFDKDGKKNDTAMYGVSFSFVLTTMIMAYMYREGLLEIRPRPSYNNNIFGY